MAAWIRMSITRVLASTHVLLWVHANGLAAQTENKQQKMPWEFFRPPKWPGDFRRVRFLKWHFQNQAWALLYTVLTSARLGARGTRC